MFIVHDGHSHFRHKANAKNNNTWLAPTTLLNRTEQEFVRLSSWVNVDVLYGVKGGLR